MAWPAPPQKQREIQSLRDQLAREEANVAALKLAALRQQGAQTLPPGGAAGFGSLPAGGGGGTLPAGSWLSQQASTTLPPGGAGGTLPPGPLGHHHAPQTAPPGHGAPEVSATGRSASPKMRRRRSICGEQGNTPSRPSRTPTRPSAASGQLPKAGAAPPLSEPPRPLPPQQLAVDGGPSFREMLATMESTGPVGGRFPGGKRGPQPMASMLSTPQGPGPLPPPAAAGGAFRPGGMGGQSSPSDSEEELPMRLLKPPGAAAVATTYGPDGMPASEDLAASEDPKPRHRALAEHRRQQYLRGELEGFEVLDPHSVFLEQGHRGALQAPEVQYVVQCRDRHKLPHDAVGLTYRLSKDIADVDTAAVAPWGVVVSGIEEDDDWLRVGGRYLPMTLDGVQVLSLKNAKEYLIDNSELHSDAPGVAYRLSRNMEDRDPREGPAGTPQFGTIVTGVDLEDGWVKVGHRYLPMKVHGLRVLFDRSEKRRTCHACGATLRYDSIFCPKCGTRAEGTLTGEGEGNEQPDQMQKELDDLYRELHRRMMREADANSLAEPLAVPHSMPPLPPIASGLLDFPIAPHGSLGPMTPMPASAPMVKL